MGAFCVFGMSRTLARSKAERKVPTMVGDGKERRALPIADWAALVRAKAEEIFDGAEKAERISPEFDAPQFCRDWIAVAPNEVRLTKIMVRGPKVDETGKRVLRNGAPVMTWHEYEQAAAKALATS
jgi:hypothetical protein